MQEICVRGRDPLFNNYYRRNALSSKLFKYNIIICFTVTYVTLIADYGQVLHGGGGLGANSHNHI